MATQTHHPSMEPASSYLYSWSPLVALVEKHWWCTCITEQMSDLCSQTTMRKSGKINMWSWFDSLCFYSFIYCTKCFRLLQTQLMMLTHTITIPMTGSSHLSPEVDFFQFFNQSRNLKKFPLRLNQLIKIRFCEKERHILLVFKLICKLVINKFLHEQDNELKDAKTEKRVYYSKQHVQTDIQRNSNKDFLTHFNLRVDFRMMYFNPEQNSEYAILFSKTIKYKHTRCTQTRNQRPSAKMCDWNEAWKTSQCQETSPSSKLISHNRKSVEHLTTTDHRQSRTQYPYRAVLVTYIGSRTAQETAALHLFPKPNKYWNMFQQNIISNIAFLSAFVFSSVSCKRLKQRPTIINQFGVFGGFEAIDIHLWSTLSAEHMSHFLHFLLFTADHNPFVFWN